MAPYTGRSGHHYRCPQNYRIYNNAGEGLSRVDLSLLRTAQRAVDLVIHLLPEHHTQNTVIVRDVLFAYIDVSRVGTRTNHHPLAIGPSR